MDLRFPESDICQWAEKYKKANPQHYQTESTEFIAIKSKVEQHGCLDTEELFNVAHWKSPRRAGDIYCHE